MSRNVTGDRRVQHTQHALHEALIGLVREKDYDEIAVREILARAHVGRSTFYAHFADKDELLVNSIEHIIANSSAGNGITAFSLPIFEHHDRHRRTGRITPKTRELLHSRLRSVIAERLRATVRPSASRHRRGASLPCDLLAEFVASTFVVVLDWWLDARSPLTPVEVDKLFLSLVACGVPAVP